MSEIDEAAAVEVSVVMPCLDEAATVGGCVERAWAFLRGARINGEVVVADNGSGDGSVEIAERGGARVVKVAEKGYGNALMGGIEAARGRFVIMADADGSYDVMEAGGMVEKLRGGAELVQGCRLPAGGGKVMKGAMPMLHRWVGNPALTGVARVLFGIPTHDIYCGMRGFTRALYDRLELQCTGMEFATEMVIKARLYGAAMAETPITLHPDGRKGKRPHLRTFRDGWRTLRFFLMYSPAWLFLAPAVGLAVVGAVGYLLVFGGVAVNGARLDAHTLLCASLLIIVGHQLANFWLAATVFATNERLRPKSARFDGFFAVATLERGILIGVLLAVLGVGLIGMAVWEWKSVRFGDLDYGRTMRIVIPGVTLATIGLQTVLASFFISTLGLRRRERK